MHIINKMYDLIECIIKKGNKSLLSYSDVALCILGANLMYGCSHILFYNPTIYLSMNRWHACSLINRKLYEDEICAQFNRP